jgi:hypothetical protein
MVYVIELRADKVNLSNTQWINSTSPHLKTYTEVLYIAIIVLTQLFSCSHINPLHAINDVNLTPSSLTTCMSRVVASRTSRATCWYVKLTATFEVLAAVLVKIQDLLGYSNESIRKVIDVSNKSCLHPQGFSRFHITQQGKGRHTPPLLSAVDYEDRWNTHFNPQCLLCDQYLNVALVARCYIEVFLIARQLVQQAPGQIFYKAVEKTAVILHNKYPRLVHILT